MPGANTLGWIGAAPAMIGLGLSNELSAAVFEIDQQDEAQVSAQVPSDTYFVCVTLSGSMDWDAQLIGRRVVRPCLPGSVDFGYPGESAQIRYLNARARIVHFYLPVRWFMSQIDELAPSARYDVIDLKDPMHARCDAVSRHGALIVDAMRNGDATRRLEIESIGLSLAATLLRLHSNVAPKLSARGGLSPFQLKRITEYLDAHLSNNVSLAELAGIAQLSPYHFCRAFKQSTGLSPQAWTTRRRIERAQDMMRAHPAMGLLEIALCVGYESQSAFGVAFKRVTGASPGGWRRRMSE